MALNQLNRGTLPPTLSVNQQVYPTILIGLGGCGKEVLLRLRRRVVEQFGTLDRLPFVKYLHIDTDQTEKSKRQDDAAVNDPLLPKIKFNTSERANLSRAGDLGQKVDHLNRFPNIASWLPAGSSVGSIDLTDGAGQVRMASRLCLFDQGIYSEIISQLNAMRQDVLADSVQRSAETQGFNYNAGRMIVYVVGSLGGGTGSGIFLDIGEMLKRIMTNADRVGIFFLPSFFMGYSGAERIMANGYGALKELNHYVFGNHFEVSWDGSTVVRNPPPPYSWIYLMDNENDKGSTLGSSGEEHSIFQMVAESIFLDFAMGSFADNKRATRVNLLNFMNSVWVDNFWDFGAPDSTDNLAVVGDSYPTRYASLGLSSLYFPLDAIQSACACRLGREILEYWKSEVGGNIEEALFTNFLNLEPIKFMQGSYTTRDHSITVDALDVEDALLWFDKGNGRTFLHVLAEKVGQTRLKVSEAPYGQKLAILEEELADFNRRFRQEGDDTREHRDEWGEWINILEQNKDAYLKALTAAITKESRDRANDGRYGVAYALNLLQHLKRTLRNVDFKYIDYFEVSQSEFTDEIEEFLSSLEIRKTELGKYENRLVFRKEDVNRVIELIFGSEDGELEESLLYSYWYYRLMKQVARRGQEVCEDIEDMLGMDHVNGRGLMAEFHKLLAHLNQLSDRLRDKERYYASPKEYAHLECLYREGDEKDLYQQWMGQGEQHRANMIKVANNILTKVFAKESISEALAYIEKAQPDEVEDKILLECKDFFAGQPEQPSALDYLFEPKRYPAEKLESTVRRIYNFSRFWLKKADGPGAPPSTPKMSNAQSPLYIGVDHTNPILLAQFKDMVEKSRQSGDPGPVYLDMHRRNKGHIVFFNEVAGVPLFYIDSITKVGGLKAEYEKIASNQGGTTRVIDLHTDKNWHKFADLIPKEDQAAIRYKMAVRSFVLSRLLGILDVVEVGKDGNRPIYHFAYRKENLIDGSFQQENLGEEFYAIYLLDKDPLDNQVCKAAYLEDRIDNMILDLQEKDLLPLYNMLLEFYIKHVYPPQTDSLGKVMVNKFSPMGAALFNERERLHQNRILTPADREAMRRAMDILRGGKAEPEMALEDYDRIFKPLCRQAGVFPLLESDAVGGTRTKYRAVWAIDRHNLDKLAAKVPWHMDSPAPAPKPAPAAKPVPSAPTATGSPDTRPCPRCGQAIKIKSIFCQNCGKDNREDGMIAKHLTCPNCNSPVPDDLKACWNCGHAMGQEKQECPGCLEMVAPLNGECPDCGYPLKADNAPAPAEVQDKKVICPECNTEVIQDDFCSECGAFFPQDDN